jgi:hypothetical protein
LVSFDASTIYEITCFKLKMSFTSSSFATSPPLPAYATHHMLPARCTGAVACGSTG